MTTGPGQDYVSLLLQRSDEALISAKTLLEKGLLADSVSRAYYAMFYAAQAILLKHNLSAKSHSGTISLFGRNIVEKGLVPRNFGRLLNDAHDLRQKSDYDAQADFELPDITHFVDQAGYFVGTIKQMLI
jgi:uncharacterized protein (UPF0332 family)